MQTNSKSIQFIVQLTTYLMLKDRNHQSYHVIAFFENEAQVGDFGNLTPSSSTSRNLNNVANY